MQMQLSSEPANPAGIPCSTYIQRCVATVDAASGELTKNAAHEISVSVVHLAIPVEKASKDVG